VTTARLPESRCPKCGYRMDAATAVEGESTPVPDDVSMCARCGELLQFAPDMSLRSLPASEYDALGFEQWRVINRMRKLIAQRRGGA
jgi:ribosomal protein S27AE